MSSRDPLSLMLAQVGQRWTGRSGASNSLNLSYPLAASMRFLPTASFLQGTCCRMDPTLSRVYVCKVVCWARALPAMIQLGSLLNTY